MNNKLKEIVVSLEIARELKENGYSQENTFFYWITHPFTGEHQVIYYEDRNILKDDLVDKRYNLVAAPTATEIGERLRPYLDNSSIKWETVELEGWIENVGHMRDEANSRSKLWLFLKKNNLLEN